MDWFSQILSSSRQTLVQPPTSSLSMQDSVSTEPMSTDARFESLDVWMKQQDELSAQIASEAAKNMVLAPSGKKKAKRVIDINALGLEQQAVDETGDENWIGKLMEYRQAHPISKDSTVGLTWTEATINANAIPRFTCSVLLSECSLEFNTSPVTFSSKKAAKQFAAKKAIDWLIENKLMPSDGSIKFPKQPPPLPLAKTPQTPKPTPSSLQSPPKAGNDSLSPKDENGNPTSFASQVPDLCHRLGFTPPQYRLTTLVEGSGLWDGYADFCGDPRIERGVGEVKSVFGKKNAKEESAKLVMRFLRDIERQRIEGINWGDGVKRKRVGSVGSVGSE